jgi:hypothetical protein
VTFVNQSATEIELQWLLYAVLRSIAPPNGMREVTLQGVQLLAGQSGGVAPVLFILGGASVAAAPYPALVSGISLTPGETRSLQWVLASLTDQEASFQAARLLAERTWDAEIARLELENSSLLEVETGDPEWDLAFALGQRAALMSYLGPTSYLPAPSPVAARVPDAGYSQEQDGRDYASNWEGQSTMLAFSVVSTLVMLAPELLKGTLRNFLHSQRSDGEIDGKPGMAGQRSGLLSPPLLCYLTWLIYLHTQDRSFLQECFPRLLQFLDSWFTQTHDRDGDGFPEWDHTLHAGFDDWPTFVRWHRWGQGLDLRKAETPDLATYLVKDHRALIAIAMELGAEKEAHQLQERADQLSDQIQATWSEDTNVYHHRDRDLNMSMPGGSLGKGVGSFSLQVGRDFDPPVRILVRSEGEEGASHAIKVFLHGKGRTHRKRIERMTEYRFQWFWDFGTATSEKTYTSLDRFEVSGVDEAFETEVRVADFSMVDLTGLLPLWADLPESAQAKAMIRETLLDPSGFWRPYGIPSVPAEDPTYVIRGNTSSSAVNMVWNTMLGEGLITWGFYSEAAELVGKLMGAVVHNLRKDGCFRFCHHADTAEGYGERDHVSGLPPLSLFLQTLGLRLLSPGKIILRGKNPYPWPIAIRWRGIEIRWDTEGAMVTFQNGQTATVTGEEVQQIEMLGEGG